MAELPSIPGYEVESLVAQGPRTEVWRARHRRTGRLVAVKRPRPGIGRSRSVVARLEHEARVLAAVSHEHVVGLVAGMRGSWWRGRAPTVLVTEYAAGGSLAQLLDRRGRLSPGEVITLGVALVRAVEGLVSRGFVHGRIHPEHVVFSEIGKPLLVGFGSATTSPPAPVGGSSDLADVARLLVLALTGGPPVPGTSVATLAPATPPGLVDVLDRWLT
ncbi:MAG: protein kinase, partial [Acidothermus sp.]|nr:protein kinase [Acidothermus sp.]